MSEEYTGGSVSYYTCSVTHPINEEADPYDAECIDIIDALAMTPNEANAFKALWRRAAARLGKSKKGYTDGLYDAEKVAFYGQRLVEIEQRERRVAGAEQLSLYEDLLKTPELDAMVERFAPKADPFGPRDADGWYTWNGDDTMRPAGRVEMVVRDTGSNKGMAEEFQWNHDGSISDIVKWRPAQEAERPPKRWELGTRLRRTEKSSKFFTHGKEYEILEMGEDGRLAMEDDTGQRHTWTESEARKRFERA